MNFFLEFMSFITSLFFLGVFSYLLAKLVCNLPIVTNYKTFMIDLGKSSIGIFLAFVCFPFNLTLFLLITLSLTIFSVTIGCLMWDWRNE